MKWSSIVGEDEAPDISYRYEFLPARRFAYVSDAVTALTGCTPEDHYADPDLSTKLVHGDDAAIIAKLISGERQPDEPLLPRWITRDGRLIWTEHRVRLIRDEEGRVVAVEGDLRDVTRQRARWARLCPGRGHRSLAGGRRGH